jgi:hypothetical protein
MKVFDPNHEPQAWGTWEDAEALRRWSFERRTPEQRLAWLKAALEIAYQSGAIKPSRPVSTDLTLGSDPRTGPEDMLKYLKRAPKVAPIPGDER